MKNVVLDSKRQLSQSIIWKLQRDFFHKEGINAWQNKVPFYVTSNTYFSKLIAKTIRLYILEALIHGCIDPKYPIYIVELGVGSGQFSSRALIDLFNKGEHLSNWGLDFRYVMTDFTQSNLDFWNSHPNFTPYVNSGKLDFGLFNCDNPKEFETQHHNWKFGEKTQKNPIVLITNYVYDSISHDLFRFSNGQIEEGLLSVDTHNNNLKNNEIIDLHKLSCSFDYKLTTSSHYNDSRLNEILEFYRQNLYNAVITIPIGAMKCIDFFNLASEGGVFNITSDKGFSDFLSFEGAPEIHIAFHSSFSLMVNFHALGLYTRHVESAYFKGLNDSGLKTCLLFFNHKSTTFPETKLSLEEGLNAFSSEDFLNIKKILLENASDLTLPEIFSVLKFSQWDPKVFQSLQDTLMEKIGNLTNAHIDVLKEYIPKLVEMYYELPNAKIPHFDIGRLYHFARDYNDAIKHYTQCIRNNCDVSASYFNSGLCHYCLMDYSSADKAFRKCKEVSPDFQDIDDWIKKVDSSFEV